MCLYSIDRCPIFELFFYFWNRFWVCAVLTQWRGDKNNKRVPSIHGNDISQRRPVNRPENLQHSFVPSFSPRLVGTCEHWCGYVEKCLVEFEVQQLICQNLSSSRGYLATTVRIVCMVNCSCSLTISADLQSLLWLKLINTNLQSCYDCQCNLLFFSQIIHFLN